jgi:deoxyhypusine synthase
MASKNIEGINVTSKTTLSEYASMLKSGGFQASELGRAVDVIKAMKKDNAYTFLAFTSNMVSGGMRELFAQLCRRKFCDAIVTGVGSVEEDVMKISKPFLLGTFNEDDGALHRKGVNRIGNILVPNDRYVMLEKIDMEFYSRLFQQKKELRPNGKFRAVVTPSELVYEYGKFISEKFKGAPGLEKSWVYWAYKNGIKVVLPAPTDGAMGMHLAFFRQDYDLVVDAAGDMRTIGTEVGFAKKTGAIILGGGFAKHHTIGLNIMRGGLDYAVYVSTGTQYDGSMTGARTNEAVSWGKISEKAKSVYVEGDATIIFPIIIAQFL